MVRAVTINIRATDNFSHIVEPIRRKIQGLITNIERFNTKQAAFSAGAKQLARDSYEFANRMKWVSASVLGAGFAALKAAGDYEELAIRFEILTGSAKEGIKLLNDVRSFALDAGPFSQVEITDAAKALLNYKVAADQVIPSLQMLATNAAGADIPLASVVDAFGRMSRTGFGNARSLLGLRKLGLGAMLSERLGISQAEVQKNIKSIPFPVIQEVMIDKARTYGDLLKRIDGTTWDLIGDTKTLSIQGAAELGLVLDKYSGINDAVKSLNENLKAAIPQIKVFAAENPGVVKFALAVAGIAIVLPVLAVAFSAIAYAVGLVASVATGWWVLVAIAGLIYSKWEGVKTIWQYIVNGAKVLGGAFGIGGQNARNTAYQAQAQETVASKAAEGYSKLPIPNANLTIGLSPGLTGQLTGSKKGEWLNTKLNTGVYMGPR